MQVNHMAEKAVIFQGFAGRNWKNCWIASKLHPESTKKENTFFTLAKTRRRWRWYAGVVYTL